MMGSGRMSSAGASPVPKFRHLHRVRNRGDRLNFRLPSPDEPTIFYPMEAANEYQPLIDEIFREKVLRARAQSPGEKFVAGLKLFEDAVVRMRGGIQAQFPQFSAEEVEKELCRRIERIRQVEDYGFFQGTPPI
jgi:hypothetical protein